MNLHNQTGEKLTLEKCNVELEHSSCIYVATSVFDEYIKPIVEQDDKLAIRKMTHYTIIVKAEDMPKKDSDIKLDENLKVYPKKFLTKKGALNKNPVKGKKLEVIKQANPHITFIDEIEFRKLDKQADMEAYRFKYDEN